MRHEEGMTPGATAEEETRTPEGATKPTAKPRGPEIGDLNETETDARRKMIPGNRRHQSITNIMIWDHDSHVAVTAGYSLAPG